MDDHKGLIPKGKPELIAVVNGKAIYWVIRIAKRPYGRGGKKHPDEIDGREFYQFIALVLPTG
ncbi:MAG: hypothetical protein R3B93_17670 [Bacteroidia bacterium]